VKSGLCQCTELGKYAKELKSLIEQIDEDDVKKQSYVLKALADPTRIRILHLLKKRPMCTCEIMVALDLTEPNASHHLNLLERNQIVKSQRTGKWIFYKLQRSTIRETMGSVAG
jgi:ArsR family transcriptional regulator